MGKDLSDMTNEELWQLFPIILSEHDAQWKQAYQAEKALIENAVGQDTILRISHIGSTSVTGLIAKPTIDMLLEILPDCDCQLLIKVCEQAGYLYCEQPDNPPPHMMFMKGYTPRGFEGQAFHLHVRYSGDWNELYFRDYLQKHQDVATQYGELKMRLQKVYEHDRDGYTQAKTAFILAQTEKARKELGDIYKPKE